MSPSNVGPQEHTMHSSASVPDPTSEATRGAGVADGAPATPDPSHIMQIGLGFMAHPLLAVRGRPAAHCARPSIRQEDSDDRDAEPCREYPEAP